MKIHAKDLAYYLKMYALKATMTMKEVRESLAKELGVTRDMTYKYGGTSKMDVAKIRQTVDFLNQHVEVTEEDLLNIFYPTPAEELTQTVSEAF